MQAIAIFGFLILVGLTGGVQFSGEKASAERPVVSVSSQYEFGGVVQPGVESEQQNVVDNTPTYQRPEPTPVVNQIQEDVMPISVDTFSVQNITDSSALARGEVLFAENTRGNGTAFFVVSSSRTAVTSASASTYEQLQNNDSVSVIRSYRRTDAISQNISRLEDDTRYYYRLCYSDAAMLCGEVVTFDTTEDLYRSNFFRRPSVSVQRAEQIQGDSAELTGRYTLNSVSEAIVFLVYGEDRGLVQEISSEYDDYSDIQEFDEDLQKVRLDANATIDETVSRTVDDLENNTEHYYRFCVEYDDDLESGIVCSGTNSFETKSRNRDNPDVRNQTASVTGTQVRMTAEIDMEDYLDGHAFVVYGTSEQRIKDSESRNRFTSVYQSGDQIQKRSLDTDFDGQASVWYTATDLATGDYYYRFCVEYEAEDDFGRDEDTLSCGSVQIYSIQ